MENRQHIGSLFRAVIRQGLWSMRIKTIVEKMKLVVRVILFLSLIMASCSKSRSDHSDAERDVPSIKIFLNNLRLLFPGYTYDLVLQDNEKYYQAQKIDSLFFPEYISVIGYLPDTSKYYGILYGTWR
ncbi:MAG TPA: hypothetical protein VIU12_08035 [Chryseolinea sp.]